jgi:hypothetical protein
MVCCAWELVPLSRIPNPHYSFHQDEVSKSFYEMEIQNKLNALLDKEIETGIVEGQSKNKGLNTCRFER